MNGYLSHSGFIVSRAELKKALGTRYADFLQKLTLQKDQKVGPPKTAVMYKLSEPGGIPCVTLPRTMIPMMLKSGIMSQLSVLFAAERKIEAKLNIELYANQKLIIDHIVVALSPERRAAGTAAALLNLRPGMGKTFVAAGIISALGLRTLYVVPKCPLAVQAVKDLKMCFHGGDGAIPTIGMYGPIRKKDPSSNHMNHDITVIVIDSALKQNTDFFSGYSLIIYDEEHTYCTPKRQEIFWHPTHACLGMSGTTENRSDGFDAIAHRELAFGGIIRAEEIPGFTYEDIIFKSQVDAIYYNGPPEYTEAKTHSSTGRVFTPYMNEQFLTDPFRMKLAVKKIRELYDWRGPEGQKHGIYIFCEEREPLKDVFMELSNSFVDDVAAPELAGELKDVGEFIGGIKEERINFLRKNARVLLTTYGYSGTGVSIDEMTAIVFLTPRRANMLQILARILRRGGDRSIQRRVIDIIDNKTPIRFQYSDRAQAYEYYDMEVIATKVSYKDL